MLYHSPTTTVSSDFARIEDIGAAALQAGRRAAAALCALPDDIAPKAKDLLYYVRLLTTERLFAELALSALGDLEEQLHNLVQGQTYHTAPYGWHEADGDLTPDRRLTELGRRIEHIRAAVAEAVRLARYMQDLTAAERVVGRARGLIAEGG